MALINIPTSGLWSTISTALNSMFSEIYGRTGWASYSDTQYTSASPLTLATDTVTALPNNAGSIVDSQKPTDITTFYDGTVITGRNGDGLSLTFDFKARPTNQNTTEIEIYIDITGGTGTPANLAKLYDRLESFDKGVGVEKAIAYTINGYTLGTWESNGGVVKVVTNGACEIYDVRYVLSRTHKAR